MAFSHLHVHTTWSRFDGLAQIEDLFRKASELHQPGLAITDHGTMAGVPEFLKVSAHYPQIKPVVGCEFYLAEDSISQPSDRNFHLILLAKNLIGYYTLLKLCSIAGTEGLRNCKPRIDHKILSEHHEGLIALSACIGGEIPQAILNKEINKAKELILWYKDLFGDDFYLEVSAHHSHKTYYKGNVSKLQETANKTIFRLGKDLGVKVVATNDVHMVDALDYKVHEVLLCCNTKTSMEPGNKFFYTGEEYLKGESAMLDIFADHPEALSNTLEILDKIERYSIESPEKLPAFPLPEGFKDENEYLGQLVLEGLEWRRSRTSNPEFGMRGERERLDYELGIISNLGYTRYFLVIWDLVRAVRSKGHFIGIGRSVSPASMVCYVLGITDIDPMSEPFLLFERFINPDEKSFLGIDLDFDREGCRAAYCYLQHRYGADHVSRMAITPRRFKGIAIRDAFKAYDLASESAKDLLEYISYPEYAFKRLRSMLQQDGPVLSWYNSASHDERSAFDAAAAIEATKLHPGIHSCAVLISDSPMTDHIPLQTIWNERTGEMERVSQYDQVSGLGPVRLNLYELHPLDIIREASKGLEFPDTFDDPEVFRLFSEGNTDGIFMFEPEGMRNWLKKTGPTKFSELVDLYTMYRPGVMEHFDEYLENRDRRRHGLGYLAPYDTVCSNLAFTENTYGLPIYQEQILLAARFFGDSKTGANQLRKALFCRGMELKDRRADFFARVREKGYSSDYAEKLWSILEDFGKFAFPLSHAAAYVATAYRMAWLKVHHQEAFTNACRKFTVRDE